MRAGILNETIAIYRLEENKSDYGDISTSYKRFFTTRARVEHKLGTRTV